LNQTRQKRRFLKHGTMKNVYGNNIVIEYYLKGKRKFSQLNTRKFYDH
jgi:hypothetical protein